MSSTGRVTENTIYSRSQESMNVAREKMVENQEQATTLKRINKPSDDPMGAMRVIGLRSSLERTGRVSSNLETAGNLLNVTDAALGDLSEIIARAKEIAIQMGTSSNQTDDARNAVARESEQLAMRVIQIGNTRFGERYIFGGYKTDKPPFDDKGNYFGDAGNIQFEYGGGQRVTVNTPGTQPFFGISEISKSIEGEPPLDPNAPGLAGELRSPASVLAANRGLNLEDNPEEMASIEKTSGVNIFKVMKDFAQDLVSGNIQNMNTALDSLDVAFKQVIGSRTLVGAQQNMIDLGVKNMEKNMGSSADMISKIEDADSIAVFAQLAKNQNMLNVSLETNKKLLAPSLIEFLK